MAKEIAFSYLPSQTLDAIVKNGVGLYVSGTTPEAFDPTHWGAYTISLAEYPSASGQYHADFPLVVAGPYTVEIYIHVAGTDADGPPIAVGAMAWNGTAESFTSLSASGQVRLDLTQALTDVKTSTVGGALHGAWAVAFGKMLVNVSTKVLSIFGWNSQSVALQAFDLDDATTPTTRTPR